MSFYFIIVDLLSSKFYNAYYYVYICGYFYLNYYNKNCKIFYILSLLKLHNLYMSLSVYTPSAIKNINMFISFSLDIYDVVKFMSFTFFYYIVNLNIFLFVYNGSNDYDYTIAYIFSFLLYTYILFIHYLSIGVIILD